MDIAKKGGFVTLLGQFYTAHSNIFCEIMQSEGIITAQIWHCIFTINRKQFFKYKFVLLPKGVAICLQFVV